MLKNFSIITSIEDPELMQELVVTASQSAKYPGQLQFIFFISPGNKPCVDMAHKLYSKNQPDLFDPYPIATIIATCNQNVRSWETHCKSIADAPNILVFKEVSELVFYQKKHWDEEMLLEINQ